MSTDAGLVARTLQIVDQHEEKIVGTTALRSVAIERGEPRTLGILGG